MKLLALLLLSSVAALAQYGGPGNAVQIRGRSITGCIPTNGQVYAWNSTSNAWDCASNVSGSGAATFDQVGAGTNLHVLTFGAGGGLTYAASGYVNANRILGTAINSLSGTGSQICLVTGTLTAGHVLGIDASGNCIDAGVPYSSILLSSSSAGGDASGSLGSLVVTKTNGVSFATVATSGSYTDLANKPTIATVASTTNLLKGNSGNAIAATPGTDYVIPAGNAATATALAANPSTCSSGYAPTGIGASGAAANCTPYLNVYGLTGLGVVGLSVSGSVFTPSMLGMSGNTTTLATVSGSLPSGNIAKYDASGNLIDSAVASASLVQFLAGYFLTSRSSASVAGQVNLGLLSPGLMKISTSIGIATFSTAVANTDYVTPAGNAATATALAASPSNCSSGQAPQGVNASGTAQNCTAYVVPGVDVSSSNQVTVTHLASPLPVAQGGTNAATATAHYVFTGPASGSAAAPSFRALVASDVPTLNQSTTGNAATATALATAPAKCGAGYAAQGVDVNGNSVNCTATGGPGGGVSMASQLGDFAATVSGTTLTIGSNCSSVTPCSVRFGAVVYSFSAPGVFALASGTGTVYVYVSNLGVLTVAYTGLSGSCTSGCTAVAGSAFPTSSLPINWWAATSGAWTASGNDSRSAFATKNISAGTGISTADDGYGGTTVSVDSSVVTLTSVPGTSTTACQPGMIAVSASLLYICTSSGVWAQASIAWPAPVGGGVTTITEEHYFRAGRNSGGNYDVADCNTANTTDLGTDGNSNAYMDFTNSGSPSVLCHYHLPHNWNAGEIDIVVDWTQYSGGSAGNVGWQFKTACVAPGATLTYTFNTPQEPTAVAVSSAGLLVRTAQNTVTTTGCAADDEFYFLIARDNTVGSNYANPASVQGIDLRYSHN